MDALQYLRTARLAPNGELLDRTEKLALILLALELTPDEDRAQPDIDRLAEGCLVNRRSMFRILDALERKRALRGYPQKTPSGQSAPTKYELIDDKGRVLQATPYPAGRVLPDVGESVTEGGGSVTGNTLDSVTRNTLPEPSKPNSNNILRPAAFGTPLAPSYTPNNLDRGGLGEGVTGNTPPPATGQADAVRLWFQFIGTPNKIPLNPSQIAFINSRVTNLAAWKYTLEGWAANPRWRPDNLTGQVERYETKTLCLPQFQAPAPASSSASRQKTQGEEADDRATAKLIYGDQ